MKKNLLRRPMRLLTILSILGIIVGLAGEARADVYGYAVQETSGYTFSGATVGTINPLTGSSAAQIGSPTGSESHTGVLDALQSYVGPGPRPGENTFTPVGMMNADYVRGDSLVTTSPSFTTHNVAEGFLNGPGNSAGSGSWSVSAPITLSASGAVTLGFSFTNQLSLVNAPTAGQTGNVASDFGYIFSIQDSSGSTLFSSAPNSVNRNVSLVSAGSLSLPSSGSLSITSGTLAAGTYTATISGSEHVFLNVNAVPEPSSMALLATGLLACGAIRKRLSPSRA